MKKHYSLIFLLLTTIIILCTILIFMVHKNNKLINIVNSNTLTVDSLILSKTEIIDEEPPTLNNVYNTILSYDIDNPKVVLAQAILESGWMSSHKHNNLFGMAYPRVRVTTALFTSPCHYAHYASWEDSILDYKYYQDYNHLRGLSEDDYLDYLQRNYADDPQYSKKLKSIIKSLKSYNI